VLEGRIMQRVEQKLAEWNAINTRVNEARAKLREAQERSDLEGITLYGAEVKRLDEESDRALAQVQAALADHNNLQRSGDLAASDAPPAA
jgi:DNA repair ATPase RecN